MMPQQLLPLLVMLPLAASIVCLLVNSSTTSRWVSMGFAILLLILASLLLVDLRASGAAFQVALGGWQPPLGILLKADGLATLMIILTALLNLVLCLYGLGYFNSKNQPKFYLPLWWLLIAALNALFLSADTFNIYVTLELVGLSAVALVAMQESTAALTGAFRYLLVSLSGSLGYLLGIALLYRAYGTLDLYQLGAMVSFDPLGVFALGLMTIGLLAKTALVPLHFWLPAAHASAPAPVSAILSALVVKASFYLLLRFWFEVFGHYPLTLGWQLMGVLGALAIIWGSIQAIRAQRVKLLVAYSTVAQLGYLFLCFPLFGMDVQTGQIATVAFHAVIYIIIAHACAKAAMFLVAGSIAREYGHDHIHRLEGIARHLPIAVFAFAIAGASLIGLPPSGGFIAKWLLLKAAVISGQWWWAVVVLAGGLAAAVYVFRILNLALQDSQSEDVGETLSQSALLPLSAMALALLAIGLGFHATSVLSLADIGFNSAGVGQ
jgi:formate hydrogenlyase subunit 3/multisubunit Na+/H+ antiporter MnhD subunit